MIFKVGTPFEDVCRHFLQVQMVPAYTPRQRSWLLVEHQPQMYGKVATGLGPIVIVEDAR
jgi:hypothetical protein